MLFLRPSRRLLAVLLFTLACLRAAAQGTVPVVMLSDIHFDPFHNPRLVPQLVAAPIARWPAILDSAQSLVEDADRLALQAECHAHGADTDWPLLKTAVSAAHQAEPHPVLVTLTGDLLSHEFPCRFHHTAPSASDAEMAVFSEKTVQFVIRQLWSTFPKAPIYAAMGNNDSGCADYAETPDDPFSRYVKGQMVAGATRLTGSDARLLQQLAVSPEGDYSYALPAPFVQGRLIVLQDIYDAQQYKTCAGASTRAPETAQLAWLREQLEQGRTQHQQVWVVGHIPPGIDVFASFAKYVLRPGELCSAQEKPFLADTALADTLVDYADVIRLGLFAHTHMDEMRVLHRPGAGAGANPAGNSPAATVPVKLVPSITPYFGNHPAFVLAAVDPRTMVLKDWETWVSPASSGSTPPWTLAYRFSSTYHMPDFSSASAQTLADSFTADRTGKDARSHAYREHFFAGDIGLYAVGLEQIWPAYACAVREDQPAAFHECLCPAAGPADAQPTPAHPTPASQP